MPVTIGNAPAGAAAFGRSVGPALSRQAGPATQPTLTLALPTGVTFDGVDNPAWACTTTSAMLQCLLPALAAGESSSGLIQLGLADTVSASITLQLTIADGSGIKLADVRVDLVENLGGQTVVYATTTDNQPLNIVLEGQRSVELGSTVAAYIDPARLHLFNAEGMAI